MLKTKTVKLSIVLSLLFYKEISQLSLFNDIRQSNDNEISKPNDEKL
ncbi:MAG TPA: hypothetical protein PKZ69_04795 [Candidatus Cloacimonadota bacterium]|nr:hypothetical protein [Candidatus Cloacimonadota bacterium]HPK40920.1 hypothetical protein [Candidatus Cloacimonadota bacterium]